ncbi:hypothetical protein KR038_011505 [Drosophila bunnanda]|nr:hypothetical protein KR038_011505 [Drosophila bunnanda]
MNEKFEGVEAGGSSHRPDTKAMYQRCLDNLYTVNIEIVARMSVLNERMEQHRQEARERETNGPTAFEIYITCFDKAELDLQEAERLKYLKPSTRDLVHSLQTILNVTGKLGGPRSADLLIILNFLFSTLLTRLPPVLIPQLEQTMEELEPYRQRLNDLFKIVPEEEPTEDI